MAKPEPLTKDKDEKQDRRLIKQEIRKFSKKEKGFKGGK